MAVVPLFFFCCTMSSCAKPPATYIQSDFHASLSVLQPNALTNSRITVRITDSSGHPVNFDRVSANLTMTTMIMPPYVVNLVNVSPGVYAGTGTFTMSGAWSAAVRGAKAGRSVLIGTFPVSVKD